jgi:hypothetical protein
VARGGVESEMAVVVAARDGWLVGGVCPVSVATTPVLAHVPLSRWKKSAPEITRMGAMTVKSTSSVNPSSAQLRTPTVAPLRQSRYSRCSSGQQHLKLKKRRAAALKNNAGAIGK